MSASVLPEVEEQPQPKRMSNRKKSSTVIQPEPHLKKRRTTMREKTGNESEDPESEPQPKKKHRMEITTKRKDNRQPDIELQKRKGVSIITLLPVPTKSISQAHTKWGH